MLRTNQQMPDHHSVRNDEFEMTTAEQAAEEMAVTFKAKNLLRSDDFWDSAIEGRNTVTAELPSLLSLLGDRWLAIQEADERGKEILRDGIARHVERFMKNIGYARSKAEAQALADANELTEEQA